ncbi:MAG: radical SAM protein [Bacteroidales bacterium]|nr:radical SAM protein [Bacteroidales bacterium]
MRFVVDITDHCNLRCKGCDAFAPLADKYCLDPATFEKDCARIAELTRGKLEFLSLLGGEPLLHEQCADFFIIARKYFKNTLLLLWTNGIILAKQSENFWKTAKETQVKLMITKYPINLNYGELEKLAKTHNVPLSYVGDRTNGMFKRPFDLAGKQDYRESFRGCKAENDCITLREGKLYVCDVIAKTPIFNKFFHQNLTITEKDCIDIYKAKSLDEILTFLYSPSPFCRYCKVKETGNGLQWAPSKKMLSEWI